MEHDIIVNFLRQRGITKNSGYRNYEKSKEVIFKLNLSSSEYQSAIKFISNYLGI